MRLCRPYSFAGPMKHRGARVVEGFDVRAAFRVNSRKRERDRPGRSVRRLAEQMGRLIPRTDSCPKAVAAGALQNLPTLAARCSVRITQCHRDDPSLPRAALFLKSTLVFLGGAPIPLQCAGVNGY